MEKEISLINYYQAVARKQLLAKSDMLKLQEIAENSSVDERIHVGAYLLLDNQIAAEIHFRKLDEETRQTFVGWPIYRFWKNT